MERHLMSPGDNVIISHWNGEAYLDYLGIVKRVRSGGRIDAMYSNGIGDINFAFWIKSADDAAQGETAWRASDLEFNAALPLLGQPIWISKAREGQLSSVSRGIILSNNRTAPGLNQNLRVAYLTPWPRIRTFVPQEQATMCDDFWSITEPDPVFCDDDD